MRLIEAFDTEIKKARSRCRSSYHGVARGASMFAHFPFQPGDPPPIFGRRAQPLTTVYFRLAHPRPQRLRVNTQLPGHPGQLPAALPVLVTDLEHHLHRALAQLLGVLPLCRHGSASSQESEPPR
jgi:hypothetical protein